MTPQTHVAGAERMMIQAKITGQGIRVQFADGAKGLIPLRDLKLGSPPQRIELPNLYVIILKLSNGQVEEIPWDYARHYADPGYEVQAKRAARHDSEVFAQRIRTLRKEAGLTQEQLAKQSKIDRVTLARIELGEHYPRYETLLALARGLKADIARLLMD